MTALDENFRCMAISDLIAELENNSIKFDEDFDHKVCESVFSIRLILNLPCFRLDFEGSIRIIGRQKQRSVCFYFFKNFIQ